MNSEKIEPFARLHPVATSLRELHDLEGWLLVQVELADSPAQLLVRSHALDQVRARIRSRERVAASTE